MNEWKKFLGGTWRLTKGYWQSEEKLKAWGLLIIIVALNLITVYITVLINKWYNGFYNALQNFDKETTVAALKEFTVLAAFFIFVAVYQLYLRQMLQIKWRRWITGVYITRWLENQNYYRMQTAGSVTDNPDQRISDDLNLFTNMTLRLSLGLLKAVVTLVSFVAILWELSGVLVIPIGQKEFVIYGYMVWAAIAYALLGTWLTHIIGKPLIKLNFNQQRYEADFRFSLVRLRENSESVAFYNGEEQEKHSFLKRFYHVVDNFWQIMRRQKQLTWFTSGYAQLAIIFPIVVAAPRYFAKEIQLGGLMQISSAFGRVQDALSFFVEAYTEIAEWRAVVERLTGFVDDMENVRAAAKNENLEVLAVSQPSASLILNNLEVKLPDGKTLLQGLNLKVSPGDRLLVAGSSGSGKSTLLRTLAGIWPYAEGKISLPQNYNALFVPQKPYLPLGTLREVLLYPLAETCNIKNVSDKNIKEVMGWCRLEWLYGKLDHTDDWSRVLSLGEQQRVAFARVFLKQPDWLFLDEATSALDEPIERLMYELLLGNLNKAAVVSVGHRSTLNSFHKQKLVLEGGGGWNLLK